MNENIDDILEKIDDMIDKAPTIPLSGKKVMISADDLHDLLDEIRLNLPSEIKHAKLIVMDRQAIMNDANKEAEGIIAKAEQRAKALIDNDRITKEAQAKAKEIMIDANRKSKDVQTAIGEYVDTLLSQTEDVLTYNLTEVKKKRQAVHSSLKIR